MSQGLKDRELQQYYESLFAMYGTEGWSKLMEDLDYMLKTKDTPRDVNTAEQLHHRRGELAMMDWLRTHQERTEFAYAELLKDEHGDGAGEDMMSGGVAKVIEADGSV